MSKRTKRICHTPICGHCGLFCKIADEYTNFGNSGMLEPPDPIYLCARCSQVLEDTIVASVKKPACPHIPWRPSTAHWRAIKRLGMVLAGPRHAAWCRAFWPDNIPKDYEIWPFPKEINNV